MDADRTVEDTAQDGQQPAEISALAALFLNIPDQLVPTQAAMVVIDERTTRQGSETRPSSSIRDIRQQEGESVDTVQYSFFASAVPEPNYVSHPPASEANAQSARTSPEDSGGRNLTQQAAGIDTAEPNLEADLINQEKVNQARMEHLLEHLALLAAENPRGWTVAKAIAYIAKIPSCTECVEEFSAQITDREALFQLTEDYLINTMGFSLGLALKVCDVVRFLIETTRHGSRDNIRCIKVSPPSRWSRTSSCLYV
ncbi:uncharacterized protein LOC144100061 isoform X2 [Amblyomma americanum]